MTRTSALCERGASAYQIDIYEDCVADKTASATVHYKTLVRSE